MITLYDNPFSPFTRKVRMVLDHKGLEFARVDALALAHAETLRTVNPRGEVPVLVDDGLTVVNSADIVAYLDHRYPRPPVYPADPAVRVAARAWERLADTVLDAIIHDISIWTWPTLRRDDVPPPGLIDAGRRDLAAVCGRLEDALRVGPFLCGEVSVADFAVYPHLSALRPLGLGVDASAHPTLAAWMQRMRGLPVVARDLAYIKDAARAAFVDAPSPYEAHAIVWRGDRIEWLFHHGLAAWWFDEYQAGRAVVPGAL
jgi:glutathione S-transferase